MSCGREFTALDFFRDWAAGAARALAWLVAIAIVLGIVLGALFVLQ